MLNEKVVEMCEERSRSTIQELINFIGTELASMIYVKPGDVLPINGVLLPGSMCTHNVDRRLDISAAVNDFVSSISKPEDEKSVYVYYGDSVEEGDMKLCLSSN